uniref:Cytochrome c-type biogenesis protein H TPR domain-containing protein n=1 Tax=Magnetococcus massalia (strain MO-1) TaxID=451514 RepID=A0A1S7LH65_MAGMO|nr:Conserved protein of unknown function. TPR repeat-containing protein [Candidatus Magnetococcus massalia]
MITLILATTALLVFYPAFTRSGSRPLPEGLEGNPQVVLEDRRDLLLRQLKELELDSQGGLVDTDDAATVREGLEDELGKVLQSLDDLKKTPRSEKVDPEVEKSKLMVDRALGVAILAIVGAASLGMYAFWLGTPTEPQIQARQQPAGHPGGGGQGGQGGETGMPDIKAMVAGLAERLQDEPDNIEGWMRLGRSYQVMGNIAESLKAYTHILERQPENLDAAVSMSMVLLDTEDKPQMELGLEMLEKINKKDPQRPEALWYLGIFALEDKAYDKALSLFNQLLPVAPERIKPRIQELIQQAEKGKAAS